MAQHDRSYKLLFSHPQMVRDLLAGFVREDWLAQLDFASLQKVDSHYISDKLHARASDLVWRARWGKDSIYLYFLMEFQSSVDARMAVRMLTYVGLLYEGLRRSGELKGNEKLPPVFPIVLYSGRRRWRAPTMLSALIHSHPRCLRRFRPQMGYLLIDQGKFHDREISPLPNLAAALFRLENSNSRTNVESILLSLHQLLKSPKHASLRRAFCVWLNTAILARMGGPLNKVVDLLEMRTVISERFYKLDAAEKAKVASQARKEGKAELLLRILRKRYGRLPAWVLSRVQEAGAAEIGRWAERLEDVQSLHQLFRGERRLATR